MPSIRDNDLRKSPEYCHYLEAVKDGELTLPDFKIDDNGVPDIHPYEVYCRVKGCLKRTVPSANRNILVKHLKDKNSHGMEFTLHNGPPTMKELMEAKAWYEGLFEGTVLPTPTPTKKRKRAATKSKDHNTKGVENSNEGEAGNDQDNGEGPSSGPYAVHTPVTGRNLSKPVLPRDEKGKPLFMQIRREGSKAAKSAGEKGTIPCKTCRNAKGKAPCGSKPYCEFWRFFSSIDEAKGASMQPQGSVVDLEALESSSNNPETSKSSSD